MSEEKVNTGKGLGIAGMILGILGLIAAFNPCIAPGAIVLCLVGLILSAVSVSKAGKANAPKGMGIAGLVTSIIGTIIVLCWMFIFGAAASEGASAFGEVLNDPALKEAIQEGLDKAKEAQELQEGN